MSCPRHTRTFVHQTSRETSFVTSSETELIKRRHTHETHAPHRRLSGSPRSRAAVVSGVSRGAWSRRAPRGARSPVHC